jgi:hypothetical protein
MAKLIVLTTWSSHHTYKAASLTRLQLHGCRHALQTTFRHSVSSKTKRGTYKIIASVQVTTTTCLGHAVLGPRVVKSLLKWRQLYHQLAAQSGRNGGVLSLGYEDLGRGYRPVN